MPRRPIDRGVRTIRGGGCFRMAGSETFLSAGAIDSAYYAIVLVGDDPSEIDGDPSRDGVPPSPGAGIVELRAQGFGPRGARRTINVTVGENQRWRKSRVMSWRETS